MVIHWTGLIHNLFLAAVIAFILAFMAKVVRARAA